MALGATVYKAQLDLSDLDRNYYASHLLTVARHPSETEERLMLRVLAFALHAGERLEFGRGLSAEGEPALWAIDDTGSIETWIDVGTPDVRQVRKSAGRSAHVTVLAYDEAKIGPWWSASSGEFSKIDKLTVLSVSDESVAALAAMASRNMKLAVTIQDGTVWVSDDDRHNAQIDFVHLKEENQKYLK